MNREPYDDAKKRILQDCELDSIVRGLKGI